MKVVILAGGFGTRLSEETIVKPKPMVEIGDKPILWHIMKTYSYYGYNDFIICLGYKGYLIKEYFSNYLLHQSDLTINLKDSSQKIHNNQAEPWTITLIDTGLKTATAGRIKRIRKYVEDKTFMLTYGDGVSDVNIKELVEYHRENKKYATVTAVQPPGRFGALEFYDDDKTIKSFQEKPMGDKSWINGGFFVLEPEIFNYTNEDVMWEKAPLEDIAKDDQLLAYKHYGFWRAMDTLRDKNDLEKLWSSDKAAWKLWK